MKFLMRLNTKATKAAKEEQNKGAFSFVTLVSFVVKCSFERA
jgi:hypothetical protein